jgi:DEAD/DEAH box helicase domain-containing protein
MDVDAFLDRLRASENYAGQMVHVERIPGRDPVFGTLDSPLEPRLETALRREGVERYYSHQADAINAARAGKHVATVTSTASGKTLCYNVPVLDDLLREPHHRALYLFPTKALAQDQLEKLNALGLAPRVRAFTYDGDTPREERTDIRRRASIILTNPDMLSVGIVPYHSAWALFLRQLRWVVVDEVHSYRGVFGSHVANVFRRLRRVCELYGARPQFLCSSATIANPGELVKSLTGFEPELIDEDGSPHGPRHFVFWNPPYIGEDQTQRRSTNIETTSLFSSLVAEGVRTIAFARSRQTAELILRYARDGLKRGEMDLSDRVTSYRAGYLPEDRREIERRLFSGDLLGVVSTNALELGVDIGGLDASILNGYPGSVASVWQQAGRAGRGRQDCLAVLVAQNNPLDQYLMRRPEYFFGRPHEHAAVDPNNLHILRQHLRAAAYEMPLSDEDARFFGIGMALVLKEMEESGDLRRAGDRWVWCGGEYPAGNINIRSASGDAFVIRETGSGRAIGTEEIEKVFHVLHPGAVYLQMGESYLVENLDVSARTAWVTPAPVSFYTRTKDTSSVDILSQEASKRCARTQAYYGPVTVTNQVLGFSRRAHFTDEVKSVEDLDMPEIAFDTEALWFVVPSWAVEELRGDGADITGGLHAIEHAAIGLMPLYAMCDRNDIGGVSYPLHPVLGAPAVFIYDAHPGGVGIAERTYDLLEPLLRATRDHIAQCPCEDGCPSCIQSPKCGSNNEPLSKAGALAILGKLLG